MLQAMPDPFSTVRPAADAICNAMEKAVRRYAEVSGLRLGNELIESFLPSFVFDRLGDQYAMTLETNTKRLLARDAMARGRAPDVEAGRAAELAATVRQLDPTERVDLVLYREQEGERSQWPFLALVEFKLWRGWPDDHAKLLRILQRLETCPFGIVCFIAAGAAAGGWLEPYGESARQAGDVWLLSQMTDVIDKGSLLSIGAQIVRRPA
jgi:hypothetical protein